MVSRPSTFDAQRIALIKPSALGDVVQSLPVLAALRERFPTAQISWVVNAAYAPLLRPISLLDDVIAFDRAQASSILSGAAYNCRFLKQLHRRRFDFVLDLQCLLRSGLFALATAAHRRWGLRSAREGAGFAYTRLLDDVSGLQTAVDRYWKAAEALGVGASPKRFPLELSADERSEALAVLRGSPQPWIAVQPGARWETKRWPAASFAVAVQDALGRTGGTPIILGAKDEREAAEGVADRMNGPVRNLAGKTSLRLLAAILEQCDVLVTNDTGPMHLAAAVGTPTVSIFTCTSPKRAAPFGEGHRIVQTNVACRESYLRTCQRLDCMNDVAPRLAAEAVIEVLKERRSREAG